MRIPEEYTRKSMAEILVIDDDIKESRQIKTFLSTEKKYGVTLFRPVLEKEKYPDKTFDVVIFSDSMKETVGRLIRNEHFELSPEIQFITIVSRKDTIPQSDVDGHGIFSLLLKPYTRKQLLGHVVGALCIQNRVAVSTSDRDSPPLDIESLKKQIQRIDAVINSIGEGLLAIDNHEAVVLMNAVAEEILGVKFGECAGVDLHRCGIADEIMDFLLPLLKGVLEYEQKLLEIRNNGEETCYFAVNMKRLIDEDGRCTGRVLLFIDRSDTVNMEIMRESFLSVAAHELRTPISIIMNYLTLLEHKMDDIEFTGFALKDMFSANNRLHYLVDSLINFITFSSRNVTIINNRVDVVALLREVIVKFENERSIKNITIQVTELPSSMRMNTDAHLLSIIFKALLSNAIKFNRENGAINIGVKNSCIDDTDWVSITFSDEGEGINPEVMDRLFDNFRQGEDHLTRTHSGLGTGLYIAQRVTKLLGGRIHAESLNDGGSRFSLEIPCSRSADTESSRNRNIYQI